MSLETQKPWNLSFWYVNFQAYTELTWFRKFQVAENHNVTSFELSDADIARKHTLIGLKAHLRHVSLPAYTELTLFRKFQDAENIIVTIFALSDVDIARMHTTISLKP